MVGKPANSKNCDHNDKHLHNLKKNKEFVKFWNFLRQIWLHCISWWVLWRGDGMKKKQKKGGKNLRTKIRFGKVWYNAFHCAKVVFYTNGLSLSSRFDSSTVLWSFEDQSWKIGTFTKGTFKKKKKREEKRKKKEKNYLFLILIVSSQSFWFLSYNSGPPQMYSHSSITNTHKYQRSNVSD